jgi:hypothetical protein
MTRRVQMEWNAFYAAMAGSSATVIGLIFVAVQLKSDKFSQKPLWRAVASSTFFIYFMVFFLSLTFLIPAIGKNTKSIIIFAHVGLGAYRVVRIWFPVWHDIFKGSGEGFMEAIWFLAGPFLLYSLLAYHAVNICLGKHENSFDNSIAIILLVLLGLALRNSWNLLVDGAFQKTN